MKAFQTFHQNVSNKGFVQSFHCRMCFVCRGMGRKLIKLYFLYVNLNLNLSCMIFMKEIEIFGLGRQKGSLWQEGMGGGISQIEITLFQVFEPLSFKISLYFKTESDISYNFLFQNQRGYLLMH